MFNKEKNNAGADKAGVSGATLISAGTVLTGDVQSDDDLRIDGTVQGNISCAAKVIVGPNGYVHGDMDCAQADIAGKVTGNISAKELLQLRGQCQVQGNITTAKLGVEPAAVFNGYCGMDSTNNIIQMNTNGTAAEI